MTPEERAQLDALAESLARVERRLEELENRIQGTGGTEAPGARGQGLGRPGVSARASVRLPGERVPAEHQPAEHEPQSPTPGPRPPASGPQSAPGLQGAPSPSLEAVFGLTWVSRIAVVTVVLALAFFFEYAFEKRWITETGRTLIGAACGLAGLALGERFWRVAQATYGQALTAAGVALLYLSVWAAFGLYHLLPHAAAFGLMVLCTALAGLLALRYGALAVAVLGLAGGYATPMLLGGAQDVPFVLGYALLLDAGAVFASRARDWRWPEALALAGTACLYVSQFPVANGMQAAYTAFVLAYFGLFAASRFLPVFLAAQLLVGITLAGIWSPGAEGLYLDCLVTAAGLGVTSRRGWGAGVAASLAGFWIGYLGWRLPLESTPGFGAAWGALTIAYLLFLAWPAWQVVARDRALRAVDLLAMVVSAGAYFAACYGLLETRHPAWEGTLAVAVAVSQIGLARILWPREPRGSLLAAGAGWALLILAAPVQFVGYRVTIVWALEAAAAVWVGARMGELRAVRGGLAVFLLVLVRLGWIDSRMFPSPAGYPLLANTRFLTFAAAAAALWGAAWWVRRGRLALATHVSGHAVMLWGLGLEAMAWAARTAAPQNVRSFASASISVLAAAYAVLLVAGGVIRRDAPTRILGIALIGAVVLKLYLYDIWLLGAFYRMAAFAILGALLWVMAYLYSRFRGAIGNWWR